MLACATYDGFLFPPMENLLAHLKTKNFQSRTIGLMENGTWPPWPPSSCAPNWRA